MTSKKTEAKKTTPKAAPGAAKKTAASAPKKVPVAAAKKTATGSGGGVKLADWGFRLAVIESLYSAGKFEKEMKRAAKAAASAEPYTISKEARAILDAIPLTPELLAEVKSITTDGGGEVYAALTSEWDGEDDLFDIRSLDDVTKLPELESLTLISMLARGVDVSPIADVPKLKSLFCQDGDWLKGVRALKKTLTARGVKVTP